MAVLLGYATGCGNPCRELSEKICSCQPTTQRQTLCTQQVDTLASQWNRNRASPNASASPASEADGQKICAQLLPQCSCAALQAGHLQACGLALEPATP